MKWIDTHSHLYAEEFLEDREEVITRARAVLSAVYLPHVDRRTSDALHQLAADHPDFCLPTMGIHPCSVTEGFREDLAFAEKMLGENRYYGIGEIGLDLYWDKTTITWQREALEIQLGWAKSLGLPVILHTRESFDETIEMVEKAQDGRLRGIFHCFTGSAEEARRAISANFMLGIGGVITFKNAGLAETVKMLSLEHLVLETDSPYIAPVPHRGKRNESAYITHIAEKLAEIKEISLESLAEITSKNARAVFGNPEDTSAGF